MDFQLGDAEQGPGSGNDAFINCVDSRADMLERSVMDEGGTHPIIQSLISAVNEIALIGEYRKVIKRECANLTRRVKLLGPLFEDIREFRGYIPERALAFLGSLDRALQSAKELLRLCHDGSKIYLVLERETVIKSFLAVTAELEQALDGLPYNMLDISDEVREQVELVHAQLKRAKGRVDTQDMELYSDVNIVLSESTDRDVLSAALERLAEKLELKTFTEIRQESIAFNRVILEKCGEKMESFEQMSLLLRLLKDLALKDSEDIDMNDHEKNTYAAGVHADKPSSPVPDDFRCPISLELMRDPVIVATGQTYERSCIQKWVDAGNKTCPKTQQTLPHLILTPNYVLRSLIVQWCETHGIDLPKKGGSSKSRQMPATGTDISAGDRQTIEALMQKLSSGQLDVQRAAAGELRLLAKRNGENRVWIAEAGAIPLLVGLLSTQDLRTQEHAVTALLNLSIHDSNKGAIVRADAIAPIVEVLRKGSMEARENAAATLFSLSVLDDNKVLIGASGAIPALVSLLCDGSLRGKKDAAT
eukprot:c27008_g1_i1 orf=278-1879(+)